MTAKPTADRCAPWGRKHAILVYDVQLGLGQMTGEHGFNSRLRLSYEFGHVTVRPLV